MALSGQQARRCSRTVGPASGWSLASGKMSPQQNRAEESRRFKVDPKRTSALMKGHEGGEESPEVEKRDPHFTRHTTVTYSEDSITCLAVCSMLQGGYSSWLNSQAL